jgi:hypothetical protein
MAPDSTFSHSRISICTSSARSGDQALIVAAIQELEVVSQGCVGRDVELLAEFVVSRMVEVGAQVCFAFELQQRGKRKIL